MNKLKQTPLPTPPHTRMQVLVLRNTCDTRIYVSIYIRQVAPKWMPLGVRLLLIPQNIWGRFVESVKNAWWSMRLQETGDGLESIVEFQVQIKGHNRRKYEENVLDSKIGLMKSLQKY